MVGQKSGNDQVLLTLVERKSREYWMFPIKNRHADSVMEAFHVLQKTYSEHFSQVFKTITQTMVLSFQGYLNLKNCLRRLFSIHIHIRHAKKELMNVITVLYEDLYRKVNVSVTLM